jgi:hypothetical protein
VVGNGLDDDLRAHAGLGGHPGNLALLLGVDQRTMFPFACPCGTASSVQVVLRIGWSIHVHDQRDAIDVDPAGHVRRDQGRGEPVAEGLQGAGADSLGSCHCAGPDLPRREQRVDRPADPRPPGWTKKIVRPVRHLDLLGHYLPVGRMTTRMW